MTDDAVVSMTPLIGTVAACAAAGRPRATHYRRHRPSPAPPRLIPVAHTARAQPSALTPVERAAILAVLHSERFCDAAPAQVWATLLDEGVYLGSQSTFYRLLRGVHGDVRERRSQATHPAKVKPELVAHGPNQVWSWDITKLHGSAKWNYFYLYVILDVYSRKTVGWMLASRESATLAEQLIAATITTENVPAGPLTLHADRGSSMASKPVALLLADLGVTKTHSRPRVSNDNPYSEAQFNPEVLPQLPRHLRLPGASPRVLHQVLPHLQPPPPACRPRATHPPGRPQRTSPDHPCRPRERPRRGARPTPQSIPPSTPATQAPRQRMDQPTPGDGGHRSVIAEINCPTEVDRFRKAPPATSAWSWSGPGWTVSTCT